jgi:hypothetical protein
MARCKVETSTCLGTPVSRSKSEKSPVKSAKWRISTMPQPRTSVGCPSTRSRRCGGRRRASHPDSYHRRRHIRSDWHESALWSLSPTPPGRTARLKAHGLSCRGAARFPVTDGRVISLECVTMVLRVGCFGSGSTSPNVGSRSHRLGAFISNKGRMAPRGHSRCYRPSTRSTPASRWRARRDRTSDHRRPTSSSLLPVTRPRSTRY